MATPYYYTVQVTDPSPFPAGYQIEARRWDKGWGTRPNDPGLIARTAPGVSSFNVPRTSRQQLFYMRLLNNGVYSRRSAYCKIAWPLKPVDLQNITLTRFLNKVLHLSFDIPGANFQDIWRIIVQGPTGDDTVYWNLLWDATTFQYRGVEITAGMTWPAGAAVRLNVYNLLGEANYMSASLGASDSPFTGLYTFYIGVNGQSSIGNDLAPYQPVTYPSNPIKAWAICKTAGPNGAGQIIDIVCVHHGVSTSLFNGPAKLTIPGGTPSATVVSATDVRADYTLEPDDYLTINSEQLNSVTGPNVTPQVLKNGWAGNTQQAAYELGVDQGFNWGQNGEAVGYNTPEAAYDGNGSSSANIQLYGTHTYAGCIWYFPGGFTINSLIITSEANAGSVTSTPLRSAGIWYSVDGGSSWVQIYNQPTKLLSTDTTVLPTPAASVNVQVMAFTDAHDDQGHWVYEISANSANVNSDPGKDITIVLQVTA